MGADVSQTAVTQFTNDSVANLYPGLQFTPAERVLVGFTYVLCLCRFLPDVRTLEEVVCHLEKKGLVSTLYLYTKDSVA